MRVHDKREPVTWVAALVIVQHKLDAGNHANACHSLNRDPAFRRIFPRMNSAAFCALAQFLVGVEPLVEWRKVLDDVRHRDLDAVHLLSTVEAVPLEAVTIFDAPRAFDYESD